MAEPPGEDVLVVPPIPLATGQLLEPEDDGPPVRITKVEVVVSTEDGGELRIPLVPPARRLVGALSPPPVRVTLPQMPTRRFTLTRRGEVRGTETFQPPPSARRYEVRTLRCTRSGAGHVRRRDRRGTLQCLHHARPPPVPARSRPALARRRPCARPRRAAPGARAPVPTLTPARSPVLRAAAADRRPDRAGRGRTAGARQPSAGQARPAVPAPSAPGPASPRPAEGRTSTRARTVPLVHPPRRRRHEHPAAARGRRPRAARRRGRRRRHGAARRHRARPHRAELPAGAGRPLPAAGAGGRPARGRPAGGAGRRADRACARSTPRSRTSSARPPPTSTGPAPPSAIPLLGLSVHDAGATSRRPVPPGARRARRPRPARAPSSAPSAPSTALDAATGRVAARAGRRRRRAADRPTDVLATVAREGRRTSAPRSTARLAGARRDPRRRLRSRSATTQAMLRWQDYLGRLAAAGIEPPPRPTWPTPPTCPSGLSPALDARRPARARASPGPSSAARPVTVLPAETVAAVSTALSQLGKPFVAGTSGSGHLRLRRLHLGLLAAGRVRRPLDAAGPVGDRRGRCR